MYSVSIPASNLQARTARAMNSGPLSERMCAGTPRSCTTAASTALTPLAVMPRPTSRARHCRVYSSTRVNHFRGRPRGAAGHRTAERTGRRTPERGPGRPLRPHLLQDVDADAQDGVMPQRYHIAVLQRVPARRVVVEGDHRRQSIRGGRAQAGALPDLLAIDVRAVPAVQVAHPHLGPVDAHQAVVPRDILVGE